MSEDVICLRCGCELSEADIKYNSENSKNSICKECHYFQLNKYNDSLIRKLKKIRVVFGDIKILNLIKCIEENEDKMKFIGEL